MMTTDHREQLNECAIAEWMALAAVNDGSATLDDLHRLDCMARIAKALNPSLADMALAVQATLKSSHLNTGLIKRLIRLHHADRLAVGAGQYNRAIDLA